MKKMLIGPLLAMFATACAGNTQITNAWQSPKLSQNTPVKKIMILGVTPNAGHRRIFEDMFAQELTRHGVEALASYSVLPQEGQLKRDQVVDAVTTAGADCVLATRLARVKQKTRVSGGPTYGGYYGYYGGAWATYSSPNYVYQYDVVTLETNVFGTKTSSVGELIWSATTETFAPGEDIRDDVQEFAELLVDELARNGIIQIAAGK